MRALAGLIAAAALLFVAADEPNDPAKKPLDKYQGTWHIDKPGDGPGPRSIAVKANLVKTIVFDGDTVTSKAGDEPLLGKLTAGARESDGFFLLDHKDLDWIHGECKLDGDRLTIRYYRRRDDLYWQGYVDVVYQRDKN
jgi:hypothetical protein